MGCVCGCVFAVRLTPVTRAFWMTSARFIGAQNEVTRTSLGVMLPSGLSVAGGTKMSLSTSIAGSQAPGLVAARGSSAPITSRAQRRSFRKLGGPFRIPMIFAGGRPVQQYWMYSERDMLQSNPAGTAITGLGKLSSQTIRKRKGRFYRPFRSASFLSGLRPCPTRPRPWPLPGRPRETWWAGSTPRRWRCRDTSRGTPLLGIQRAHAEEAALPRLRRVVGEHRARIDPERARARRDPGQGRDDVRPIREEEHLAAAEELVLGLAQEDPHQGRIAGRRPGLHGDQARGAQQVLLDRRVVDHELAVDREGERRQEELPGVVRGNRGEQLDERHHEHLRIADLRLRRGVQGLRIDGLPARRQARVDHEGLLDVVPTLAPHRKSVAGYRVDQGRILGRPEHVDSLSSWPENRYGRFPKVPGRDASASLPFPVRDSANSRNDCL